MADPVDDRPAAQPRERGFDFTKDYVVWNTLANRLFKRRQYEPAGSVARQEYLTRAVKAAERVHDFDPEDVEAHDLLMRCYGELAGDRSTESVAAAMSADDVAARAATASSACGQKPMSWISSSITAQAICMPLTSLSLSTPARKPSITR